VREALREAGLKEEALAGTRRGSAKKLAVVMRLRAETTVPLKWIAARLQMGSRTYLSNQLYWQRRANRNRRRMGPK